MYPAADEFTWERPKKAGGFRWERSAAGLMLVPAPGAAFERYAVESSDAYLDFLQLGAAANEDDVLVFAVDYGRLIEDRRVHGSLYTDRQVFADEIDRIFRRGWIFVGHESEIPKTGDWVTRRLGREPVIMLRAAEGGVHVLANRCAHRGTLLCWQDRGGGRKSFQCSYHGWVFGLDGKLRSLPGRSGNCPGCRKYLPSALRPVKCTESWLPPRTPGTA